MGTEGRLDRGVFVTLEGPDGAGKSAAAARLADALRGRGFDLVLTREPGGTRLGEAVRAVVLSGAGSTPDRDALLFNAARAVLVEDVIRPALARGGVVVCDRYADSTRAYQGAAGVDANTLATLERLATRGLRPDLTVLLDVPVDVGRARREAGPREERTRFEDDPSHDRDYHERVRAAYLAMAAAEPERWRIVDAAGSLEAVAAAVLAAVEPLLVARAAMHAGTAGVNR